LTNFAVEGIEDSKIIIMISYNVNYGEDENSKIEKNKKAIIR